MCVCVYVGGLLNMHGIAQKREMHFQHDADYRESGWNTLTLEGD